MTDDLNLETWDNLRPREREARAKRLARELPDGFAFRSVRLHELGGQGHHVAEFDFEGAGFVLVLGGTVRLGYDPKRPWEPTPEELEDWQDTAEEYGIDRTIREHISQVTRKPKSVRIRPFLMETMANEIGYDPIAPSEPEVKEILREHFRKTTGAHQVEVHRGDSSVRVRRDAAGTVTAHRSVAQTHRELAEQLKRSGIRFPTSDEWEYACGAGAVTLFRWGDHVPCDRYPTDIATPDWDLHRRPNAFGICIASDPYKYELVAEPGTTRGGDGGCTICGGAGFFVGWLTLATAYFEEDTCRHDPEGPISIGYTIGRRVLPLD